MITSLRRLEPGGQPDTAGGGMLMSSYQAGFGQELEMALLGFLRGVTEKFLPAGSRGTS